MSLKKDCQCDKCGRMESTFDIIWLSTEDFEPLKGEILSVEAIQYDAVCEDCYQSLLMNK